MLGFFAYIIGYNDKRDLIRDLSYLASVYMMLRCEAISANVFLSGALREIIKQNKEREYVEFRESQGIDVLYGAGVH